MQIPVYIEPVNNGYRASTQTPIHLIGEGATEADAVGSLTNALEQRLQHGGKLISLQIAEKTTFQEVLHRVEENPLLLDFLQEIQAYRQQVNGVENEGGDE